MTSNELGGLGTAEGGQGTTHHEGLSFQGPFVLHRSPGIPKLESCFLELLNQTMTLLGPEVIVDTTGNLRSDAINGGNLLLRRFHQRVQVREMIH